MASYRVAEGTQVLHQGVLHPEGALVDAQPDQVAHEVASGWLVPVKASKRAK